MPNYGPLCAEWQEMLTRRRAMGDALALWTSVLDRWRDWEDAEEGYFVNACLSCRGYLKGVDRRERWNAASPLAEDWASPHVDYYAAREGYWRGTPSLAGLLPPDPDAAP